jgi:hypothetical protein
MHARTAAGIAALAWVGLLAGCPGSGNGGGKKPTPPDGKKVTVFALAEVRGQIEPCGCTTDPLGDLARTTAMVQVARNAGPTVVLDAGSLLYSQRPVPPHLDAQEKLKSDLLVKAYAEELQVAAIGLGPMDLAKGPDLVRPARQAANVAAASGVPIEPPKVIDAGGVRVGVFGVVSAEMAPGLEVGDPTTAARDAVTALGKEQPDVVVALLTMKRKDAAKLLRAVDGIDFAILGMGLDTPEPKDVDLRAEDIDGTWLVVPGNRGQVVPRLELTIRDGEGFTDAVGAAAAEALGVELDGRIATMEKEIAGFEADPTADPAFVAQKQAELAELRAERQRLRDEPMRAPEKGSYFTLEMVRIKKSLACDPEVLAAKTAYSQAAGAANVAAVKEPPEPPPPGKAGYVGVEACSDCHEEAVAFWDQTRHAGAWETLAERSKEFDHDCTSCHVTGWDKPGGSNMAFNEPLRDVQCETCHGPGSLHVEAEGEAAAKRTIQRAPATELCATQCHTPEHSDTFQLEAYLRDIVGPGHGGKRRKELGDGPTGRELRAAGLEKAGKTLGAGCVK